MIKKQPPLPPYIQPKVYFLLRTIDQIKKVYPIPYKYQLPNLSKYLT